jgi:hypothetical protein
MKSEMTINELSIGNYVRCSISRDPAIYTVVAIDGIHSKVMLSGARMCTWIDLEKINPIKLNEDILNVFKNSLKSYNDIRHLDVINNAKYVHEIQNIFRIFSNAELYL